MSKKRINLNGDVNIPQVGDSIFAVKQVELTSKSNYFKYDVFAETIVETKLPEDLDPKDFKNPSEVLIKTYKGNEHEWKKVKVNTIGPRKVDELIVSENEALETAVKYSENEYKKAKEDLEELKKNVRTLEQYEKGWNEKESLDFDEPGKMITLEINAE